MVFDFFIKRNCNFDVLFLAFLVEKAHFYCQQMKTFFIFLLKKEKKTKKNNNHFLLLNTP